MCGLTGTMKYSIACRAHANLIPSRTGTLIKHARKFAVQFATSAYSKNTCRSVNLRQQIHVYSQSTIKLDPEIYPLGVATHLSFILSKLYPSTHFHCNLFLSKTVSAINTHVFRSCSHIGLIIIITKVKLLYLSTFT